MSNEIPFDDPAVARAFEECGRSARDSARVVGGPRAAATADSRESALGLFAFPPDCHQHRQATVIPTLFPAGTEVGEDVDLLYFPAHESGDPGRPVPGAGTMFTITEDSEAARAFVAFLKTPTAHEIRMAQSGFPTPFRDANPDEAYATDALRAQGEIGTSATTFRFDGSDLIAGEIGASAFRSAMDTAGASAEEATGRARARLYTLP